MVTRSIVQSNRLNEPVGLSLQKLGALVTVTVLVQSNRLKELGVLLVQ